MEQEEKKTNKYTSRRFIITVWSCIMISVIVILGIIFKNDNYTGLAMTLTAIPIAFTSLETVNKWKKAEAENEV